MKQRVVALGVDAASPDLLNRWMDQGALPHLRTMRAQGSYARLRTDYFPRSEAPWITFLTGRHPARMGECAHVEYDPGHYRASDRGAYRFLSPPFYGRLRDRRVAVFDVPLARLFPDVEGLQVVGWGVGENQILQMSSPPGLMADILHRYGAHPMIEDQAGAGGPPKDEDHGAGRILSFRVPSVYDTDALGQFHRKLLAGLSRRRAILDDLYRQQPWDLFLAVFSEGHTAGHLLWHLSQDHPLNTAMTRRAASPDPLRDVYRAIDDVIGGFAAAVPQDVVLLVFSIHGMAVSTMDTSGSVFLPEMLYRWSFPGRMALAAGESGPPAAPRTDYLRHWRHEMWSLRTPDGESDLESPLEQERLGDPFDWQPANWYRRCWPTMKAFALPTFAEGLIRIHVAGRDPHGSVAPENFGPICDEIDGMLRRLTDARSGLPLVRAVQRARRQPDEAGIPGLAADLVVHWQQERAVDVADSPDVGRIGPIPYFRTGAHDGNGFVMARGPGIAAGAELPVATALDLTATFLRWLGQGQPGDLDGRPIIGG